MNIMDIDEIMQNLEDCFKFGITHEFKTINFDVVSIQNTQILIDNLCKNLSSEYWLMVKEIALRYIIKWETEKLINSYYSNKDSITIVPKDVESYNNYIAGVEHYTLYFKGINEKNIA